MRSSFPIRSGRRPPAISSPRRAVPVPLPPVRIDVGWRYDLDELESKIRPKTRALYLNSPQNPTGGVLTGDDVERDRRDCARTQTSGCSRTRLTRTCSSTASTSALASLPGMYERTIPLYTFSKIVRDDRADDSATSRSGTPASASARRKSCSTPPATSRRSYSSAASARSRDRRIASRSFERNCRARRDLFYAGMRQLRGGVFTGEPPAGAFYAFLEIDPAWNDPGPTTIFALVEDGGIPHQARTHRFGSRC